MPESAKTEYAHFRFTAEDRANLSAIVEYLTASDPAGRETPLTTAMRFALRQTAEKIPKKISKKS